MLLRDFDDKYNMLLRYKNGIEELFTCVVKLIPNIDIKNKIADAQHL